MTIDWSKYTPEYISASILTDDDAKKLIDTIPKLSTFARHKRAAMPPLAFQLMFAIMYHSGLRINEIIHLVPNDINFRTKIVKIRFAKTGWEHCSCSSWEKKKLVSVDKNCQKCQGRGKVRVPQFTTIVPHHVKPLQDYIVKKRIGKNQPIFTCDRSTAWRYLKLATRKADLNVFRQTKKRITQDGWTHLLRRSFTAKMRRDFAGHPNIDQLINYKGRWAAEGTRQKHYEDTMELGFIVRLEEVVYGDREGLI